MKETTKDQGASVAMNAGKKTTREVGESEPGFERLVVYVRTKTSRKASEKSIVSYAQFLGTVRLRAGRPLLELNEADVERLSAKLSGMAACYRIVLKMFYRANRKLDLREAVGNTTAQQEEISEADIMTPGEVMRILAKADSKRDMALVAVLASTGGRIAETLSLRRKNLQKVKGDGYQVEFTNTKTRKNRYSSRIEGPFKDVLETWLKSPESAKEPDAWLFPSSIEPSEHMSRGTAYHMLRRLGERAGIGTTDGAGKWTGKRTNPHQYRHAKVTWAAMNGEDSAKLSQAIWGKPVSSMMNRYSHFSGKEQSEPVKAEAIELPDVPALPVPPVLSTQAHVAELTARLEAIEHGADEWLKQRAAALGLTAALTPSAPPAEPSAVLTTDQKAEVVARRARRARHT